MAHAVHVQPLETRVAEIGKRMAANQTVTEDERRLWESFQLAQASQEVFQARAASTALGEAVSTALGEAAQPFQPHLSSPIRVLDTLKAAGLIDEDNRAPADVAQKIVQLQTAPASRAARIEAARELLGQEIKLWADKGDLGQLELAIATFKSFNALYPVP